MPGGLVVARVAGVAVLAEDAQRARDLGPRAGRRVGVEVRLVDDDQVGQLHHALLDRLQVVAGVRQLHQHEHVRHARRGRLALADADRLDDDDVVAGRLANQHRLARLLGHPAQRAAGGTGPDVGLLVHGQLLHPSLVAEDRAAGDAAGRIDGQHRDAVALLDQVQAEHFDERALADAGHAADGDPERGAGVRQQCREHLVALGPVVRAGRFQQRDRLGDGAALRRPARGQHLPGQGHGLAHRARPSTIRSASRCAHGAYKAAPGWKPSGASSAGSAVQRSEQKPSPFSRAHPPSAVSSPAA